MAVILTAGQSLNTGDELTEARVSRLHASPSAYTAFTSSACWQFINVSLMSIHIWYIKFSPSTSDRNLFNLSKSLGCHSRIRDRSIRMGFALEMAPSKPNVVKYSSFLRPLLLFPTRKENHSVTYHWKDFAISWKSFLFTIVHIFADYSQNCTQIKLVSGYMCISGFRVSFVYGCSEDVSRPFAFPYAVF
jgi:hypothetical protein